MSIRSTLGRRWAAGLIGVVLAAAALPALPKDGHQDLDELSEAQLRKYLRAELEEVFRHGGLKPNQRYTIDELYAAIIAALRNEGDSADEDEDEIDWDELEEEMAEIGSSVEDEVQDALEQLVAEADAPAASGFMRVADLYAQAGRAATRPAFAGVRAVENRLVADIGKKR